MDRNLFKYIWRHSWRDQAYILVIVVLLQVFYFISLDLPKRVVNDGIRGDSFKKLNTDTLPFMHLSLGPYPSLGIPEITLSPALRWTSRTTCSRSALPSCSSWFSTAG